MGWNSWKFFTRDVKDQDIRNPPISSSTTGMKDAGYVYVNIDDTWEGEPDADGVSTRNAKFPDMKASWPITCTRRGSSLAFFFARAKDLRGMRLARS